MEDDARAVAERRRARNVELLARARVPLGKDLRERAAELAARSRYEDASRSERIGDRVLQRCLTRSSSQRMFRSSGSAASYSRVTS